jgi:hypothetical protein
VSNGNQRVVLLLLDRSRANAYDPATEFHRPVEALPNREGEGFDLLYHQEMPVRERGERNSP